MRRPTVAELRCAAETLRRVLAAFDPADDTPADRVTRRHLEGAVIATEVAAAGISPKN